MFDMDRVTHEGSVDIVSVRLSLVACNTAIGSPSAATPTMETVTFPSAERVWTSPHDGTVAVEHGPDVSLVGLFVTTQCDTALVDMQDSLIPISLMTFA
jgi:hypothetical protein